MKPKSVADFDKAVAATLPKTQPGLPQPEIVPQSAWDEATAHLQDARPAVQDRVSSPPAEPEADAQVNHNGQLSHNETEATESVERVRISRTTAENQLALIAAVESGISARAAAASVGINLRTAYGILARTDVDVDAMRDATRKLLTLQALDRIDDWRTACDVGARKKGNHAPARDWLLHAGVIDPLASDVGTSTRIAIMIGTDAAPMKVLSPLHLAEKKEDSDE